MKAKTLWVAVILSGSLLILNGFPSHAQQPSRTVTLVYSNNLNGEIDPCPT